MAVDPAFRPYHGARALVLGATGFIGIGTARLLHEYGAHVIVATRRPEAALPLRAELSPNVEVVPFDVLTDAPAALLAGVRPDVTFNLVGYGVDRRQRDETPARIINAEFPGALCDAVAATRSPRWPGVALVHAGTQLEYGPLARLDEAAIATPDTLYGQTKLAGTQAVIARATAASMPSVVTRLFTVYGPGELPGRLLPSLIEAGLRGGDLPLTSGTQQTDFVHADDVAAGLLRLGLAAAPPGTVVNLATGRLTTVREFAITAARLLGIEEDRLRFGTLPQRTDTMEYAPVDTGRLRALVDWIPDIAVAEGIRRTLERYGLTYVEE